MTKIDLATLSASALVAIYNGFSEHRISKFSDKTTAVARVSKLLADRGFLLVDRAEEGVSQALFLGEIGTVVDASSYEAWVSAQPRATSSRTRYQDECRIEVLVSENPKRAGTKARARFDLYRTGMTVAEYKDACVALEGVSAKHGFRYLSDLAWDEAHAHITVWTQDLIDERKDEGFPEYLKPATTEASSVEEATDEEATDEEATDEEESSEA